MLRPSCGGGRVALISVNAAGERVEYTFEQLQARWKHAFPREIAFVEALPKTPSGKIQRFLLCKE